MATVRAESAGRMADLKAELKAAKAAVAEKQLQKSELEKQLEESTVALMAMESRIADAVKDAVRAPPQHGL